jgi:hypothetical protein
VKWTDDLLDRKRLLMDPLADQVVAEIVERNGEESAFRVFDLLIRNIEMPIEDLPDEVDTFVSETDRLPAWVDWQQIETSEELFLDHGPKFLLFLYYKSLPLLYTDAKGAEVLVRTGRLSHKEGDHRIFTRRIAETGQFMMDVMARDGLQPGSDGIRSIQKVRLIHAAIRRFLNNRGWDRERLGEPINQEDLALTLMSFSVSPLEGLGQFGIAEDPQKMEAYMHTWCAVGSLLGVDEDLLPESLAEGQALMEKILDRQSAPSEAGRLLAKALVEFARETLPSERLDDAPVYLIRKLIGRKRAEMLNIHVEYGCLGITVPLMLWKWFTTGEKLEDRIDGPLRVLVDRLSEETVRAMVGYFDQTKNRKFTIPPEMYKRWF